MSKPIEPEHVIARILYDLLVPPRPRTGQPQPVPLFVLGYREGGEPVFVWLVDKNHFDGSRLTKDSYWLHALDNLEEYFHKKLSKCVAEEGCVRGGIELLVSTYQKQLRFTPLTPVADHAFGLRSAGLSPPDGEQRDQVAPRRTGRLRGRLSFCRCMLEHVCTVTRPSRNASSSSASTRARIAALRRRDGRARTRSRRQPASRSSRGMGQRRARRRPRDPDRFGQGAGTSSSCARALGGLVVTLNALRPRQRTDLERSARRAIAVIDRSVRHPRHLRAARAHE